MKADELTVQKLLRGPDQYVIPLFQRYYMWKTEDWQRLWDDILGLLEREAPQEHFIGPFVASVYEHRPAKVPQYIVIDGQQRLITLVILLCALRDTAKEQGYDRIAEEIQNQLLTDPYKDGMEHYRVIPRLRDRAEVLSLVDGQADDGNERPRECYDFFLSRMKAAADEEGGRDVEQILEAVKLRLVLVMISLDGENPFQIFETLNAAGQPLEEADLIRNYVFMKLGFDKQDAFDDQHWQPLEGRFEEEGEHQAVDLTDFYRDYLMREGKYVEKKRVYVAFKEEYDQADTTPERVCQNLAKFAVHYLQLHRPASIADGDIRRELSRLQRLRISTAYPLLLHLMESHAQDKLSRDDFLDCVLACQSFAIRRSIVRESTRQYGRWFPAAIGELSADDPKGSLISHLEQRGWPNDEIFTSELIHFPIYTREPEIARLLLIALEEDAEHKEPVDVDQLLRSGKLELEHVMPQTISDDADGDAWREMLGADWQETHDGHLHSLGNLTLTGYNPEMSNKPFEVKRDEFGKSHLELNQYFAELIIWNGDAILERGKKLAQQIAQLWPTAAGLLQ